jgi:protein-tyrosine kinase
VSRIHDALKRAEQERATAQGTTADAVSIQPEYQPEPIAMPQINISAAAPVVSVGAAFSYETLQARCPQSSWSPDPKTMLFLQDEEDQQGAEAFRTLRSRLSQIRDKTPLKKLMVTSALPKEGKSFVSANLAQVLARQHGRRVLMIDTDLRSPGLHRHLGAQQSPGLSDYLMSETDEMSAMQRGPMPDLFLIAAGRSVSGAPELLGNGRLKLLLQRVEPLFDWIVLDTPPVIPVADSTLVAAHTDGILMVVRSAATPFDMARKAREEFPDRLLLGVVLNGVHSGQFPQSRYYNYNYESQTASV